MSSSYRIIEHTADTGFEVKGASLAQLFEHAAAGLFRLLWQSGAAPAHEEQVKVTVSGQDPGELLVNFLEEFLYMFDAKGMIFTRLQVDRISDHDLTAWAWGHPFQEGRDEELLTIKAITYHQLYVGKIAGGWLARVIVDI